VPGRINLTDAPRGGRPAPSGIWLPTALVPLIAKL